MGTLSHPRLSRNSTSRIVASGLGLRTSNFTDMPPSNIKAQAIASSDWRKPASATPSSESSFQKVAAAKRNRDETSSDMSSMCMLGMEEIAGGPVLYHPKEDLAAWDVVVSGPAGDLSTSPSAASRRMSLAEVTAVQLRDAKPMTMNVNGEELAVDNSFTFDVIPVPLGCIASNRGGATKKTIGILSRISNPSKLQRKAVRGTQVISEFPCELQAMLQRGQHECDDLDRPARQTNQRRSRDTKARGPSYHGHCGKVTYSSPKAQPRTMRDDEARFQGMLSRLRRSSPTRQSTDSSASDIQAEGPDIIVAKAKHIASPVERPAGSKSAVSIPVPHQQACWARRREQHSQDSGYASGHSFGYVSISLEGNVGTRRGSDENNRRSVDDTASKRLNPAAAEFKATFNGKIRPFLSPKKLARPPLTNIFPEATQNMPAWSSDGPETRRLSDLNQAAGDATDQHEPPLGRRTPMRGKPVTPGNPVTPSQRTPKAHPPGVTGRRFYLDADHQELYHGPIPFNLLSTVNEMIPDHLSNLRYTSAANRLGMFPAPAMPLPSVDIGRCLAPNANGFGTFPGAAMSGFIPPPEPQFSIGVPPPPPVASQPAPYTLCGQAPLVGLDRKIPVNRPHFPVTQKPRDHDPVKQQHYEAYLEWRKANEPGYHMKCKMRQAQRVVRQHQQRQQDQRGNPAYKTIIEKAKAAVGAAAVAAAAEKLARAESVRQELKVKVRERSDGSTSDETQKEKDEKVAVVRDEATEEQLVDV